MKEKDFISIIKTTLNSSFIGDDCAYLKDLGIVVTQDSLVEDVHFCLKFMTPYQLGYKSVMVNVSDIAASGGECKYLTVSLSLPKNVDDNFVSEFYNGAKAACGDDIQIVGGDITGSDKVFVSVCAIGKTEGRNISSRAKAKEGYKVVVSGLHGSSAAGLKLLLPSPEFVNSQSSLTNSTLSHRMDAVGEGKEKLFNINASPEFVNSQGSLTNSTLSHRMDAVGEGKEKLFNMNTSPEFVNSPSSLTNSTLSHQMDAVGEGKEKLFNMNTSPEFVNSPSSLTNSTLSHRMDAVGEGKEKLFNMEASPEFVNSQSSLTNSTLSHRMDAVGEGKEKLFNINASPEFVNSQGSLTNSTLSHQMDAVGEGKEKLFNMNTSPEFVNSQSSLTNSTLSRQMDAVGEEKEVFIKAHLEPIAQVGFGGNVGKIVKEDYAMMDTSDGLMEALSTIANESNVLLAVDFDKIPHDKAIEKFENWQSLVLFGGEDYGIVAVVPKKYDIGGVEIGEVKSGLGVDLKFENKTKHFSKQDVEDKIFNHFNSNY